MEHEVAGGGFSYNPIIDEVVHGFGERSCHPPYDRGGAKETLREDLKCDLLCHLGVLDKFY